jgi:L-fuconolactonase
MPDHLRAPRAAEVVDGHVHFWDTREFELAWLAGAPHLLQHYSPDELRRQSGEPPASVLAVQAGGSREEADWLIKWSHAADGFVSGAVLQFSPSPGAWAGVVTPLFNGGVKAMPAGVRVPVHRAEADWTDLEGLHDLAVGLQQRGLVLEALLRPDQLDAVGRIAARYPSLTVVLCHLGLADHIPDSAWRAAFARLAGRPNVSAKVSGIFGGATDGHSAVATALDAFGPDRLLFGSDWPMSTAVGSYREVMDRTAAALGSLSASEADAIWRATATRLYRLAATA